MPLSTIRPWQMLFSLIIIYSPILPPLLFSHFLYLLFRYQLKHFLGEVFPLSVQIRSVSPSITCSLMVLCSFASFKHLSLLVIIMYSGDNLVHICLLNEDKLKECRKSLLVDHHVPSTWKCTSPLLSIQYTFLKKK